MSKIPSGSPTGSSARWRGGLLSFALAVARLSLSLFIAVALAGLATLGAIRLAVSQDAVPVPDLTGLSPVEALERVSAMGLSMTYAEREYSEGIPEGRVMGQSPPPQRSVKRGRSVRVTLSLGARERLAPDLTGVPLRQASAMLESLGLSVGDVVAAPRPGAPRGEVLGQEPSPGAALGGGSTIHLLVSEGSGNHLVKMPDLIGKSLDEAVALLGSLDLVVAGALERKSLRAVPDRAIVGQKPLSGYPVTVGGNVQLTVNSWSTEEEL